MQPAVCCFCALGFLQLEMAWSIDCTASPYSLSSEQTVYSISDVPRVTNVSGSDCEFSWADGKHVLANHIGINPDMVVRHSINELITSKCLDNITFTQSCISEGIGYRTHCQPNCTVKILMRSPKPKGVATAVCVPVFAVLLLGLLGFLFYKFKHKKNRKFSLSQPNNLVCCDGVDGDPRAAEVKAGNA